MFIAMLKRELLVTSRNLKLPASIIGNNIMLVFAALFSYYLEFQSKENLGQVVHGISILHIYTLLALIEFIIAVVSILLLTVSCVQKEKQSHSLDLLLAADVHPAEFLFAKLVARVITVMTVIASGCPVIGLVFYVGGVSVEHMIELIIQLTVVCFYVGALGMFCSSCSKKNVTAAVWAVILTFLMILGTLMMVGGWYVMKKINLGGELKSTDVTVSVGRLALILLSNPLYTFLRMLNEQLGNLKDVFMYADFHRGCTQKLVNNWVMISSGVQIMLVFLMIRCSSRCLTQKRSNRKTTS